MTPKEYFEANPEAAICYSAIGYVEGDRAVLETKVLGTRAVILSHNREGLVFKKKSDEIKAGIADQENAIAEKQLAYEVSDSVNKEQAMNEWVKAKDRLERLQHDLGKQLKLEARDERENKQPPAEGSEPPAEGSEPPAEENTNSKSKKK
jgi:hypothetical protein